MLAFTIDLFGANRASFRSRLIRPFFARYWRERVYQKRRFCENRTPIVVQIVETTMAVASITRNQGHVAEFRFCM